MLFEKYVIGTEDISAVIARRKSDEFDRMTSLIAEVIKDEDLKIIKGKEFLSVTKKGVFIDDMFEQSSRFDIRIKGFSGKKLKEAEIMVEFDNPANLDFEWLVTSFKSKGFEAEFTGKAREPKTLVVKYPKVIIHERR